MAARFSLVCVCVNEYVCGCRCRHPTNPPRVVVVLGENGHTHMDSFQT